MINQIQLKKDLVVARKNEKDAGSTAAQISILTERINNITDHLKENKKDHSGRRGLLIMVSKRMKLLNYIKKNNMNDYVELIKNLKIRK